MTPGLGALSRPGGFFIESGSGLMNNPILNRRLANLQSLLRNWQLFHTYMTDAIGGKEPTPQDEADFLRLKSQIAIQHDALMEAVAGGDREVAATAQSIITVVENCILLRQIQRMNPPEMRRTEIEWHEGYLLVNDTIGILEEEVEKLAKTNRLQYEINLVVGRVTKTITRGVTHPGFRYGLVAVAVIGALIVLPAMGVYNYSFLEENDATKPVYAAGYSFLRNTVMKHLPFRDWDDYTSRGRQPMPIGYNPDHVGITPEGLRDQFLYKVYNEVPPGSLDLREYATKAKTLRAERFRFSNTPILVFFVLLPSNSDAIEMYDKIDKWRKTIVDGTVPAGVESTYDFGLWRNLVFGIQCSDRNLIQDGRAKQTLMGKTVK